MCISLPFSLSVSVSVFVSLSLSLSFSLSLSLPLPLSTLYVCMHTYLHLYLSSLLLKIVKHACVCVYARPCPDDFYATNTHTHTHTHTRTRAHTCAHARVCHIHGIKLKHVWGGRRMLLYTTREVLTAKGKFQFAHSILAVEVSVLHPTSYLHHLLP